MPGALTWDPTPAGGSQSTARGGINPSADGASATLQALASGAGLSWLYDELGTIPAATFGDSRANIIPLPTRFDVRTWAQPAGQVFTTYFERGMVASYPPQIRWVGNGGIAGDTLVQMLARDAAATSVTRKSVSDIASTGARLVFFRAGINDVNALTTYAGGPANDPAVAVIVGNRRKLIDRLTSAGMVVVDEGLHGIEPRTPTADTAYRKAVCVYLDQTFAAQALDSRKVIWAPVSVAVGDGAGGFLPGAVDNDGISDVLGLHLLGRGAQLAYSYVAGVLGPKVGLAASRTYPQINANAVSDPYFDATTAETYGTRANNITIVAAGSPFPTRRNAKIEVIDGVTMQTCEWDATVAGDQTAQFTLSLAEIVGGAAARPVVAGEVWSCEFDVFADFGAAPRNLKAAAASINSELRITCGANIYYWWSASSQYFQTPSGIWRARVTHPRILITESSAAVTAATVYFRAILNEACSVKLGIGAPTFRKLA